jgi:hypothetical protein
MARKRDDEYPPEPIMHFKQINIAIYFLLLFSSTAFVINCITFYHTKFPRPGAWYAFILTACGLPFVCVYIHDKINSCARITFVVVGIFASVVLCLAVVVDGFYAREYPMDSLIPFDFS